MSTLSAYLPTADVAAIDALLTHQAKNAEANGRSMDQMRADVLVDLLLGRVAGSASGGARALIGITVPVTSLAGFSAEPGVSTDGTFALPASVVRELAARPGTLFHRVLTDPLGGILDVTRIGYRPSADQRAAIEIRDGTCAVPSCDRPAWDCDLDHDIPYPHGSTTGSNLQALCRRHHRMKTHLPGWTIPTASHEHVHFEYDGPAHAA